ncbi:Superoxide dismutase (Fe) [Crenothrix polyspora]|uniref:Superoxide dismutase n=1 Tax=Crenothrix polyspora TaxID=360316 RepID=A0A1R4H4T4_9GAMM|nr:Fe-Mn family superoxide dismutase [Crenothrix polyspora]SJM91041.1 Superoxide dismutase (Fe) [Crenothrix polyspora]
MSLSQPSVSNNFYRDNNATVGSLSLFSGIPLSIIPRPVLPYGQGALAPYLSLNAVSLHYGKHHVDCLKALHNLIKGTQFETLSLERILKETVNKRLQFKIIFNAAAQVWNHGFYWNSLKPCAGDKLPPTGHLLRLMNRDFGHFSDTTKDDRGLWRNPGFKQKFFDAAKAHVGDGWVWLVIVKGKLEIITTSYADAPCTDGLKPLLCIDICEHAYYVDYPNKRTEYLNSVLDNLVNWDFAARNLKQKF